MELVVVLNEEHASKANGYIDEGSRTIEGVSSNSTPARNRKA